VSEIRFNLNSVRMLVVMVFTAALASAGTGVVYTCDPNINATVPGLCTTLNSTTAALYNNTFSNANANIYIEFGITDLGSSLQVLNFVNYSDYVKAATASANGVQTTALAALNSYASKIYGTGQVEVSSALGSSLGLPQMFGVTKDTNVCAINSTGCYAGVITITNDPNTPLYYRTAGTTEPSGAYDFFGTVEHETDEVLGTSSCMNTQSAPLSNGCGGTMPAAVDLFRYSAAGQLIPMSALSTVPGAYFSYDGGKTDPVVGLFYNTLDNGDDYADFIGTCPTIQHVQDAEGCPGHDHGIDITNDGGIEINILNALGYNLIPAASTAPTISGVFSHGSTSKTIEAGSWVDIYGANLATTIRTWDAATEVINGNLPTNLSGTSVTIDGKPAYVYYISPGQVNVQAPNDTALGQVNIVVTINGVASAAATAILGTVAPTFFTLDGTYADGVIPVPDGTGSNLTGTPYSYDLMGPTSEFGSLVRAVKKGELVELYTTGFGPASPPVSAGQVITTNTQTIYPATVIIGGVSQTVNAYVVGIGLYQMNVTIPNNVASGNLPLQATVDGVTTPTGVLIPVQ